MAKKKQGSISLEERAEQRDKVSEHLESLRSRKLIYFKVGKDIIGISPEKDINKVKANYEKARNRVPVRTSLSQ